MHLLDVFICSHLSSKWLKAGIIHAYSAGSVIHENHQPLQNPHFIFSNGWWELSHLRKYWSCLCGELKCSMQRCGKMGAESKSLSHFAPANSMNQLILIITSLNPLISLKHRQKENLNMTCTLSVHSPPLVPCLSCCLLFLYPVHVYEGWNHVNKL